MKLKSLWLVRHGPTGQGARHRCQRALSSRAAGRWPGSGMLTTVARECGPLCKILKSWFGTSINNSSICFSPGRDVSSTNGFPVHFCISAISVFRNLISCSDRKCSLYICSFPLIQNSPTDYSRGGLFQERTSACSAFRIACAAGLRSDRYRRNRLRPVPPRLFYSVALNFQAAACQGAYPGPASDGFVAGAATALPGGCVHPLQYTGPGKT